MRPLFSRTLRVGPLAALFLLLILLLLLLLLLQPVRTTRILAFRKGTSFFYRMNYKVNVMPGTTIFAQAAGFKVVWEVPQGRAGGQQRVGGRSVPDIHRCAELLYERHGFDGEACALKTVCQILRHVEGKEGAVAKILKLIARSFLKNDTLDDIRLLCNEQTKLCPLELIGFDRFHEEEQR